MLTDVEILLVEDEPLISELIEMYLADTGANVCGVARTTADAVRMAAVLRPNLVIVDLHLASVNGTSVIERLANTPIIICTGSDSDTLANLLKLPLTTLLRKPFRRADLLRAIANAVTTNG